MWFGLFWGCNTWSRGSLGLIKKDTSGGSETNWVLTVRLILCCHVIPHFVVTYSNSTLLLINNNLFNLRDTIYRDKHFCVIKPHKKERDRITSILQARKSVIWVLLCNWIQIMWSNLRYMFNSETHDWHFVSFLMMYAIFLICTSTIHHNRKLQR